MFTEQQRHTLGTVQENSQRLPNLFVADVVTCAQAPCIAASVVISARSATVLFCQLSFLSSLQGKGHISVNVTMPGSTRRLLLPATLKHACCNLRSTYEALCPTNPCADLCARSVNRQRYVNTAANGADDSRKPAIEVGGKLGSKRKFTAEDDGHKPAKRGNTWSYRRGRRHQTEIVGRFLRIIGRTNFDIPVLFTSIPHNGRNHPAVLAGKMGSLPQVLPPRASCFRGNRMLALASHRR